MTANSSRDLKLVSIVTGIIVLLLVVVLWLAYQVVHITNTSKDLVDPSSLIVRQVRDVSELTTAMFEMDAVVPVSDKKTIIADIPIAKSRLLYIAHGNVRVGVDLSEFQADDVQVEGDKISVTLPALKVLDSKLDLEHSSVYSYDRGFLGWGPDVVNLQGQAQREAIKKVEEAACQNRLIKTASDRVEKTVEHLLSQVLKDRGYREIIVKAQLPAEGPVQERRFKHFGSQIAYDRRRSPTSLRSRGSNLPGYSSSSSRLKSMLLGNLQSTKNC